MNGTLNHSSTHSAQDRTVLIDRLFAEASREFPRATAGQLFRTVQMRLWILHGQDVSGTEVARALVRSAGFTE